MAIRRHVFVPLCRQCSRYRVGRLPLRPRVEFVLVAEPLRSLLRRGLLRSVAAFAILASTGRIKSGHPGSDQIGGHGFRRDIRSNHDQSLHRNCIATRFLCASGMRQRRQASSIPPSSLHHITPSPHQTKSSHKTPHSEDGRAHFDFNRTNQYAYLSIIFRRCLEQRHRSCISISHTTADNRATTRGCSPS